MMTPTWQKFLHNAGAVIHDGTVDNFGNPSLETQVAVSGEIIADLSHRALIAVSGPDAEKFLQGQFTNDVLDVTDSHSQLSAQCSPKGRVLSLFRIFRRNDTLYLALPEPLLHDTLERLRKYVLMSKVTLEPEAGLTQIGYAGSKDDRRLRELVNPLPEAVNGVTRFQDVTVIRTQDSHPRFELIGPEAALESLWSHLDVHAAPVGAGTWQLLDILGGIPEITPQTVDAFVPQMINLDVLDGINFKKGCYTGQEIVARTHYLGNLKRRMFLLHCGIDQIPAPATALYNAAQRGDESVGMVVAARAAPQGGIVLLAVLQIEATTRGELRLGVTDGPPCAVQSLPYSLSDQ